MSPPVRDDRPIRRGGRLVEPDGRIVIWSVAEGRRGRRWRWTIADSAAAGRPGQQIAAHTLELDSEGRFAKLESATATALLTLHREADGSLHGHRVTAAGVDHLVFTAPAPAFVVVGEWPIAEAIAAMAADADIARSPDALTQAEALEVGDDLAVRVVKTSSRPLIQQRCDEDGLPLGLASTSWPLERG